MPFFCYGFADFVRARLHGHALWLAVPVVAGKDHLVHFPSDVTPSAVPFGSRWGGLALEVGLVDVTGPVAG